MFPGCEGTQQEVMPGGKILLGGGSGFIGRYVRSLAEKKGYTVVNISRNPKSSTDLSWTDIERNGVPDGLTSIVNLSGVNIMSPVRFTESFKKEVLSSRVDTTKLLVDATQKTEVKPESFIGISAIGYYGAEDRAAVTEDSGPGSDWPAQLCQQWEQAAKVDDPQVRQATVRIGLVLGRDGGMIQSLYWPFFFNLGGVIGSGNQWMPWIHVEDVAGIILHAIEKPDVSGVLNAVGPQSISNSEFTTVLSRSLCRWAPIPVPGFLLNTLLSEERGRMMTVQPKIIPHRTLESGYQFKYADIKSTCADCVKWS